MNNFVNLDDFIAEYLKLKDFEKTSDILAKVIRSRNSEKVTPGTIQQFKEYLIKTNTKVENDELGFEINFAAGPTSVKVICAAPYKYACIIPAKTVQIKLRIVSSETRNEITEETTEIEKENNDRGGSQGVYRNDEKLGLQGRKC